MVSADNTDLLHCPVEACLAVATAILLPDGGKPADAALLGSSRLSRRWGGIPFNRQHRWLWSVLLPRAAGRCGRLQSALRQHRCAGHHRCRTTGHGLLHHRLLQHLLLQACTAVGAACSMCRRSDATQHWGSGSCRSQTGRHAAAGSCCGLAGLQLHRSAQPSRQWLRGPCRSTVGMACATCGTVSIVLHICIQVCFQVQV